MRNMTATNFPSAEREKLWSPRRTVVSHLKRLACHSPAIYATAKRAYGAARFLLNSPHEVDFSFFAHCNGPCGQFIDIGANCGQSARSFRIFNHTFDIHSFEPNKLLEPDLRFTRRLLGSGFHYYMYGLGEHTQQMPLYVPMVGRTPHTPWASVNHEALENNRAEISCELGQPFEIGVTNIEIRPLDSFDLSPDIIKIDVEGYELSVLRGMEQTLERWSPLLMLESNDSEGAAWDFLQSRGYRFFAYDHRTGRLDESGLAEANNYFALRPRHIVSLGKYVKRLVSAA